MTGFAERVAHLQGLVVLSLQRDKLLNELAALESRIAQLRQWEERLRALTPAARVLRAADSPPEALRDVGSLGRSAAQALKDFRADPQSVRRPDITAINVFWRQASQQIDLISASTRAEWERYVNRSMPDIQPAVVRALAGDDAEVIEGRLVQFDRTARALASRLPADDEEAGEVIALAGEAHAVMEQFDLQSMPDDVQRFVEAALAEQATLALLTPEVVSWLRARGIEGNVRLSFALSK